MCAIRAGYKFLGYPYPSHADVVFACAQNIPVDGISHLGPVPLSQAKTMRLYRCLFGVVLALCVGASEAEDAYHWTSPVGGVLRDRSAAISVARVVWFSTNHELKPVPDAVWQKAMAARREGDVWIVTSSSPPEGALGGGVEIKLSAIDARVLSMLVIQ